MSKKDHPTIEIIIQGGIAEVTRKDKGIRLVIRDLDNEDVGERNSKEIYTPDEVIE